MKLRISSERKFLISLLVVLLGAISLIVIQKAKATPASCSFSSVCPTHGVSATFSGRTRMVDKGCIYGQYKHGSCEHWSLCYCPGE